MCIHTHTHTHMVLHANMDIGLIFEYATKMGYGTDFLINIKNSN
jgi:hypothetical protein